MSVLYAEITSPPVEAIGPRGEVIAPSDEMTVRRALHELVPMRNSLSLLASQPLRT